MSVIIRRREIFRRSGHRDACADDGDQRDQGEQHGKNGPHADRTGSASARIAAVTAKAVTMVRSIGVFLLATRRTDAARPTESNYKS
jgi:hypothetical protein